MLKSLKSGLVLASELLFLTLLLMPSRAHACDTVERAGPESTCVEGVMVEGNQGTWFERAKADEIKRKLRLLPDLELQVSRYTYTSALYEKETASLRSAVSQLETTNKKLQAEQERAAADASQARTELARGRPWYTSPIFWGITMFIAGAAIQHACCGPGK